VIDALDQVVLPFIDSLYGAFGYLGVVIAMSIESAAIPIPSELILPFAGWSVSRGVVEPLTGAPWAYWGAVLAGVVGNTGLTEIVTAGDDMRCFIRQSNRSTAIRAIERRFKSIGNTAGSLVSYAVGALGGRPLLERYGRYVLVSAHDLETADRWFGRWGDLTVLFSRMLPIVRTFISVPAGVARMPLWRFTLFSIVGAVPWVMLLVWAGMVLGDNWQDLKHQLRGLDYIVVAVIVLGVALFVWRHLRAR